MVRLVLEEAGSGVKKQDILKKGWGMYEVWLVEGGCRSVEFED